MTGQRAEPPPPDRWAERRQKLDGRRRLRRLLDRSSLSEESLWVQCPTHGRSARDPFTERCVNCG